MSKSPIMLGFRSLLLFLLVFIYTANLPIFSKDTNNNDTYKSVRLDPRKPSIYLEFVKTGKCYNANYFSLIKVRPCEKKSELDREYEAVWVRLVNNTRWAIGLSAVKAAIEPFSEPLTISKELTVTAAKNETEWDIVYTVDTETGCDYHEDTPEGQGCKRRETPIPEIPSPPMTTKIFVKSGESITFAVKREHLKKYLYIKILFSYEWDHTTSPSPKYDEPRHSVSFSWWNFEKGLEKEPISKTPETKDPPSAQIILLMTNCDAGKSDDCAQIGMMYFSGTDEITKDQAKAIPYLEKACTANNSSGCCFLGRAYWNGEGVIKDPVKSADYYKKSCAGGVLGGCNSLGFNYRDGQGVPQDDAQAAILWFNSCNAKCNKPCLCESVEKCRFESGAGCYLYGMALTKGAGVPKNESQAISYFKRGCEAGIANACFELGMAYHQGKLVKKDTKQARKYIKRACDQGSSAACALDLSGIFEK